MNDHATQGPKRVALPLEFLGQIFIGLCQNRPPGTHYYSLVRETIEAAKVFIQVLGAPDASPYPDHTIKTEEEKV